MGATYREWEGRRQQEEYLSKNPSSNLSHLPSFLSYFQHSFSLSDYDLTTCCHIYDDCGSRRGLLIVQHPEGFEGFEGDTG